MASGKLTAKDIWQEQNRRRQQVEKDRRDAANAQHRAALSQYKEQKSALDAELSAIEQARADAERRKLTKPKVIKVGATTNNRSPIFVWHWLVEPPKDMHVAMRRKGMGLLLALLPGGGALQAEHAALTSMRRANPALDSQFPQFIEAHRKALNETYERYGKLLAQLRDDALMARLFEDADVCLVDKGHPKEVQGQYATYKREVTTIDVPTLIGVDIEPDGLVLTYENRPRDSAKRWSAAQRIDLIKNMFRKLGVNANNLRIVDDPKTADIKLYFDDAPSAFPSVIAPDPATHVLSNWAEAIAARKHARWMVGVTARGKVIAPKIDQSFPHALIVAGTGGGKSVFCRTLIESLRVGTSTHDGGAQGWSVMLADGKKTDYKSLVGQPGILMVSSEAAQHVVLVHRAWTEMHARYSRAEQALATGKSREEAFAFPPMLVLLDELAIIRRDLRRMKGDSEEFFVNEVDELLKLAREVNIVLVISSQDIRVENIDGAWQENFKLVISLGQPSTRTLMSDCWGDDESKERVKRIGSRINAPGRGVIVQKSEDSKSVVTEFQSFMGYSPGAMDMSTAPTDEVREKWEAAAAIAVEMPRLYPRLGIDVDGPEWRNEDAKTIASTAKVVALDGKDGPIAARAKFDIASPDWVGKKSSNVLGDHDEIMWADEEPPAPAQADTPDDAPGQASTSSPVGDTEYTADSLREVLVEAAARARQEAARRGLVLPSDVDDDDDGDL